MNKKSFCMYGEDCLTVRFFNEIDVGRVEDPFVRYGIHHMWDYRRPHKILCDYLAKKVKDPHYFLIEKSHKQIMLKIWSMRVIKRSKNFEYLSAIETKTPQNVIERMNIRYGYYPKPYCPFVPGKKNKTTKAERFIKRLLGIIND